MLKTINSHMTGKAKHIKVTYHDADDFSKIDKEFVTQCYGVCFHKGKMIIGFGGKKNNWGLIGGTVEKGETYEETLKREIVEESNTKITAFLPIGYQEVFDNDKYKIQLRYVCKVVPVGPFVKDPAGSITKIKFIDPTCYKEYFDWGEIGERIIERALLLVKKLH